MSGENIPDLSVRSVLVPEIRGFNNSINQIESVLVNDTLKVFSGNDAPNANLVNNSYKIGIYDSTKEEFANIFSDNGTLKYNDYALLDSNNIISELNSNIDDFELVVNSETNSLDYLHISNLKILGNDFDDASSTTYEVYVTINDANKAGGVVASTITANGTDGPHTIGVNSLTKALAISDVITFFNGATFTLTSTANLAATTIAGNLTVASITTGQVGTIDKTEETNTNISYLNFTSTSGETGHGLRYNPTTGQVQYKNNGGNGWTNISAAFLDIKLSCVIATTVNLASVYNQITIDSTTNSKNIYNSNSSTYTSNHRSVSNKALNFNGTSNYATIPHSFSNVKSISFWIYPTSITQQNLFYLSSTERIEINSSAQINAQGFTSPTIYVNDDSISTITLSINNWYHIVVTTDTAFTTDNPFYISVKKNSSNPDVFANYFQGRISDVRFYDTELSSDNVNSIYTSDTILGNELAIYKFEKDNDNLGVGDTLISNNDGAFSAIDDETLSATGKRILVKDQTDTKQNGIYQLSTVGTGSTRWVLTRATDADTPAKLNAGAFTVVELGTVSKGKSFVFLPSTDPVVIGTTELDVSLIGSSNAITQVNNPSTNRLLTVSSESITIMDAEPNLTFDGANLVVVGDTKTNTLNTNTVKSQAAGTGLDIQFDGNSALNKISLTDELADALNITEASNSYMKFITTGGSEQIVFGQNSTFSGTTIADLGTVSTVNIDGGTIGGVTFDGAINCGSQALTNVDINSGTIGGVTFDGAINCGSQALTNVDINSGTIGGVTFDGAINCDSQALTNVDINSGTIDATTIGATTPSTGVFTTGVFTDLIAINLLVNLDSGAELTTAGDETYTPAHLKQGLIRRDCSNGNRSDTITASNIKTVITEAQATAQDGTSFEFVVENTSSTDHNITITAGAGVTTSGNMIIRQNKTKSFLAVITDASTPTVSIYQLGGGGGDLNDLEDVKFGGANFTNSLLIGHTTTGTLNSAEKNLGIMVDSLKVLTSGDDNVAIGFEAGNVITTGSQNICIGSGTDPSSNSGTNQIVIGHSTTGIGNNSVTLGNTSMTDIYCGQNQTASIHTDYVHANRIVEDLKFNNYTISNKIQSINDSTSNYSTGGWMQIGSDLNGDTTDDGFGKATSISADGNIIAIGDPERSTYTGRVVIYERNYTNLNGWTLLGAALDGGSTNDYYGSGVSFSSDGKILAIGAYGFTTDGKVEIRQYNGSSWVQLGANILGDVSSNEQIGIGNTDTISLSNDGNIICIGHPYFNTDDSVPNIGRVKVFEYRTVSTDEWNSQTTVIATASQTNVNSNGTGSGRGGEVYGSSTKYWIQLGNNVDGSRLDMKLGYSVSLSGDGTTLIAGGPDYDLGINLQGRVAVYRLINNTWTQLGGYFDGTSEKDVLGRKVEISKHGNIVAIAAPHNDVDNIGYIRIFQYDSNKTSSNSDSNSSTFGPIGWSRLGSDIVGETNDNLGDSLSLSVDGTIVAVSARAHTVNNIGVVRVYQYNSGNWVQIGKSIKGESTNDNIGDSISLSANGKMLVIGATKKTTNGAVSTYHLNNSFKNINVEGSVSLIEKASADSNTDTDGTTISNKGQLWVKTASPNELYFTNDSGNDIQLTSGSGIASDNNSNEVNDLLYSNNQSIIDTNIIWQQLGSDIDGIANYDNFGDSLSINSDGSIVAIGAFMHDSSDIGHVRVFKYNGASWGQLGSDIDGETSGDRSGEAVSLSADGTIVAIGATKNDDGPGNDSGHVRIYKYNGSDWDKLGGDIDGESDNDASGFSLSLSADGTIVAIGAYNNDDGPGNNSGHVRVYKYVSSKVSAVTDQNDLNFGPIGWTRLGNDIDGEADADGSGKAVSLSASGNILAIGASANDGSGGNSGHVRIYQYNGSSWSQLGGDIDGESFTNYSGGSVSLSADGKIVAIGASNNDGNSGNESDNRGHVRVYQYDSSKTTAVTDQSNSNFGPIGWTRLGIDIDGESTGDNSGNSVSLSADGMIVAIGANLSNAGGTDKGTVRVYKYISNTWSKLGVDIDGQEDSENSGKSVSLSADGKTVSIGASNHDSEKGCVRIYNLSDEFLNLAVNNSIILKEKSNASNDIATYGQIWVKTASPNQLYFTTAAGNDIQITSGTSLNASSAISAVTNGLINRVATFSGGDTLNGEANLFFNGTNLGIGTTSPGSLLEVRGPVGSGSVGTGVLTLSTAETSIDANDVLGKINFQAPAESSGTDSILSGASIHAVATNTFAADNNETALVFSTASSDTEHGSETSGAVFERMIITSAGNIGIGTTSPSQQLEVSNKIKSKGLISNITTSGISGAGDETINFTSSVNFYFTMSSGPFTRNFLSPTTSGSLQGQAGQIFIKNDATNPSTITWEVDKGWCFESDGGGSIIVPNITGVADAIDVFNYIILEDSGTANLRKILITKASHFQHYT